MFHGSPTQRLAHIKSNIAHFLPLSTPSPPISVTVVVGGFVPTKAFALQSALSKWHCSFPGTESDAALHAHIKKKSTTTRSSSSSNAQRCTVASAEEIPHLRTVFQCSTYDFESDDLQRNLPEKQWNVTLTMPVPISRLHVLEDQCTLWAGLPLIATVYIPTFNGRPEGYLNLEAALLEVLQLERRLRRSVRPVVCYLTVEVVTEETTSQTVAEPTNALRNRALRLVVTDFVLLSDGLHLIGGGNVVSLLTSSESSALIFEDVQKYTGVVIPAFAPVNPWYSRVQRQLALELSKSRHKLGIVHQVKTKQLTGPLGWGMSVTQADHEFKKWAKQVGKYKKQKEVKFGKGPDTSPLMLMVTARVPWFDERLRGTAWAQALHVKHCKKEAHVLLVTSAFQTTSAFAPVPPVNSSAWVMLKGAWAVRVAVAGVEIGRQGGEELARANKAIFLRHTASIKRGDYVPVVGDEELCE